MHPKVRSESTVTWDIISEVKPRNITRTTIMLITYWIVILITYLILRNLHKNNQETEKQVEKRSIVLVTVIVRIKAPMFSNLRGEAHQFYGATSRVTRRFRVSCIKLISKLSPQNRSIHHDNQSKRIASSSNHIKLIIFTRNFIKNNKICKGKRSFRLMWN